MGLRGAENQGDRPDPEQPGQRRHDNECAAGIPHASSAANALDVNSPFGMNPRAPLAPIASTRSVESWLEVSTTCGGRLLVSSRLFATSNPSMSGNRTSS